MWTPKDGRNFQIKEATFKIEDSKLTFFDIYGSPSNFYYASLNDVAAIIP